MTERIATTKTDRRKNIRLLRELRQHLKDTAQIRAHNAVAAEARKSFKLEDEAYAIRWALGWIERHVNLETGELTIPLHEPEEAA